MLLQGFCVLVCDFLMCLLVVCFYMKALDNNDLNQVRLTSGFVESRLCWGCSVSQAHKTWSRTFLFEDFCF